MPSAVWDALKPLAAAAQRLVRDHEILRVSAIIPVEGKTPGEVADAARREVLVWAQRRSGTQLPQAAWQSNSFEHFSGGRNCTAVRIPVEGADIWSIRAEDPDKEVPGRIWTTEAVVALGGDASPRFSLRLIASSRESQLSVDPHTPGLVQQLCEALGLRRGAYRLTSGPRVVENEKDASDFVAMLVDSARELPIIAVSVPEFANDCMLDAEALTRATLGLAHVVIVPSEHTWFLTQRFGKRLSTFGGAVRVYLPSFTEDADPFAHRLILPDTMSSPGGATYASGLLRSIVAHESVRRTKLGDNVIAFSDVRSANLKLGLQKLEREGAPEADQLEAARERIHALEKQAEEARHWENTILSEQAVAEERAEIAESQLNDATFRIQQLLEQIKAKGETPDSNIVLPDQWDQFADWCDTHLIGRLSLAPPARRGVRAPEFDSPKIAAQCLLWIANDCREALLGGMEGTIREHSVVDGFKNAHCGNDEFEFEWQGRRLTASWHIKNGGNTRDPSRCLRIYYAWDSASQQIIVADMPAHRRTGAT